MKAYILYIDRENSIKYMEECAESCVKYGLEPVPVKGVCDLPSEELTRITGLRLGSYNPDWNNEYACTVGHYIIWNMMVQADDEMAIVLEHDAIIKSERILDVEPEDKELLFLGPKVFSRDDYEYPEGEELTACTVDRFHGTHGYAITKKSAQYFLDCIARTGNLLPTPADGMLGINNPYNFKLSVVDPPVAVVEIGQRETFTGGSGLKVAITPTELFDACFYNAQHLPGFKKGLKPSDKKECVFTKDDFSDVEQLWRDVFKEEGIAPDRYNHFMVVGANEGRIVNWLANNFLEHPESKVLGCDTLKGTDEHQPDKQSKELLRDRYYFNILRSKHTKKIVTFEGKSKDLFDYLKTKNYIYNVVYLDMSRNEENIFADSVNALKYMAPNGILIFNDWHTENNYPVRKVVSRLKASYPLIEIQSGRHIFLRKRA